MIPMPIGGLPVPNGVSLVWDVAERRFQTLFREKGSVKNRRPTMAKKASDTFFGEILENAQGFAREFDGPVFVFRIAKALVIGTS